MTTTQSNNRWVCFNYFINLLLKNYFDDEVLNGLTSDRIYVDFNSDENISNYGKFIDNARITNKCPEFDTICKKFARNLDNILFKKHEEKTMNYCILLKYWMYNEIKKKCKNDYKDIELIPFVEKLKNMQYNVKNGEEIKFECYDNYDDYMGNWEEEKDLYEYFINFDGISKNIKTRGNENKYNDFLNHIKVLYKRKKDEECCCHVNYHHLCDHYFNCDSKYDPGELLSILKNGAAKPHEELLSKNGSDAHLKTNGKCRPVSGKSEAENKDVLRKVPIGYNKSRRKYITRIMNPKCIVNYVAKDSGYALVSCYSFNKGHPNVEHIFRPVEEEDKILSSESEEKGKFITKKLKTFVGIPPYLQGYRELGKFINDKSQESNRRYEFGRKVAYEFSGIGKKQNWAEIDDTITCPYTIIKDEKRECVAEDKLKEIKIFEDDEGKNSSTAVSITNIPHKATSEDSEQAYDIYKTGVFRVATLSVLLIGIIFVFFVYYKFTPFGKWISNKMSKKKNIKEEMNMDFKKSAPKRYKQKSSNNPIRPINKVPPKKKVHIAYQV
ncbi:variable surface protein [Plasmodium gonderi]|uniref:Variable surface protein n=1 Tax=Plasmodium gonderi TaxID=77519 RepID=A0A1Y1JCK8_PLAGO|nr:variable surface protein [Plasmodium gonderi]GAW79408.1 variable surface protein [Plasmodium gonderi]